MSTSKPESESSPPTQATLDESSVPGYGKPYVLCLKCRVRRPHFTVAQHQTVEGDTLWICKDVNLCMHLASMSR